MLSALLIARAIESGEFTPTQAIDLCADAIAEREKDVGAFVTLDLEGARKAALRPASGTSRCAASASRSRIFSTPPTCRPNTARRSIAGHRPKTDASLVAHDPPRRRRR